MKIAFSLNEVLRDYLSQLIYTYDKYFFYGEEIKSNIAIEDITDFELIKLFTKFNSQSEFNQFVHMEHPLETLGHAYEMHPGLMKATNEFMMDIEDDFDCTFELVSREIDKSIPATFFYLSKTGSKFKNIRFIQDNANEWGDADILITANPISLNNKPENKISIKIDAPYNKNCVADYTFSSFGDILKNKETIIEIINKTKE